MPAPPQTPSGFLTLTLHAHLPFVVNHGTWPHGLEWLLEAAAETYLPLLRMLRRLEQDGVPLCCNLNLTPVLLEQLAHPVFGAEFPQYLERKIAAAREDEAFFDSTHEGHYAHLARFWQSFFAEALTDFHALDGDIVRGFREFADKGAIEIITCCATHGYLPLLGTDESVRAQVSLAVETHRRHFGRAPRGIWIPECGYRPAGVWSFPTEPAEQVTPPAFPRIGVEEALAENGLRFFFVDTHLIEQSARIASPYERFDRGRKTPSTQPSDPRSLYRPYFVQSAAADEPTAVFARDPHTGLQVWSGDAGYPGDSHYLDFHKKRWPGGHRYWRVTGSAVDLAGKLPYEPEQAAERVRSHADHFVHTVWEALAPSLNTDTDTDTDTPPILCAPFDAELFGHWWFEGVAWLEAVARVFHDYATGIALISAGSYLDRHPPTQAINLPEGSWGAGGGNEVWLNPETAWTYADLYRAELFCRDFAGSGAWRESPLGTRLAEQLGRELLLLESSDWQFLITTGAARDYAEQRFLGHLHSFNQLRGFCECILMNRRLTPEQEAQCESELAPIEAADNIFPGIDPSLWAAQSCRHNPADLLSPSAASHAGWAVPSAADPA